MSLLYRYLTREAMDAIEKGVRLEVLGRRDRLSERLREAIERVEATPCFRTKLVARFCIDYSARDVILRAAAGWQGAGGAVGFQRAIDRAMNARAAVGPVDLLIRTAGEQRLSDFLLWEAAYTEFVFLDKFWPEFQGEDLAAALAEFQGRERRFGKVLANAN